MKTGTMFWNQLKWDLRFVWWAFAAVLVLAPFQVWLEIKELRGDFEQQEMVLSIAVWALMMLVAGVGVVSVIQKEVPFGRKEFWLTRPVSRGTVLGSKLVVLGLFLLLLGVSWVMTPLLTGSGDWLWMFGINFLVTWSWMLVVAAVLASLSSSLMRMFINAAILGAVVVGVLLLREVLFPKVHRYREGNEILEFGWMALLPLLLAGGGFGVVVWQYFTRRPWVGMGVFATLLVAGFLSIDRGYKFAGFENLVSRGIEAEEGWDEMGLKLQWWDEQDAARKPEVGYAQRNGERYCQLNASGQFENSSLNGFVEDILFEGEFMVDGVRVWEEAGSWGRDSRSASSPLPTELDEYRDLLPEIEMHVENLNKGEKTFSRRLQVATVPKEELKKWRGKRLSYSGKARIYVEDVVQLARVPYGQDFTVKLGGMHLRGEVSSGRDEQGVFSLSIKGSSLITFPFQEPLDRDGIRVFLVNPERGEFLRLGGGGGGGNTMRILWWKRDYQLYDPFEAFPSEAEREWSGIFDLDRAFASKADSKAWLTDCEVRIYVREKKGSFVRTVELPEIPLKDLVGSLK